MITLRDRCQTSQEWPKTLVRDPEGGHVHPPSTKILLVFSEAHMYLKYEMGCYQGWFLWKAYFFKGFPGVGENALFVHPGSSNLCIHVHTSIYVENEKRF